MLNKNFLNAITGGLAGNVVRDFIDTAGVTHNTNTSNYLLSYIGGLNTNKIANLGNRQSTFTIGSGTTDATINDYSLTSPIDETNFTILSKNVTNADGICGYSQVWQYTGTEEITINEIGFAYKTGTYGETVLLDHTILDSPITVNNGDTFIIALTIGGKATVTVN